MKYFILSLIKFILFSFFVYVILTCVWGTLFFQNFTPNLNYRIGSYGHMYSRMNEVKDFKDVDILFLGSSHSYRGFDVRLYEEKGLKVFNLGSSSQTPIQTKVLINRYLKELNPKLVIFEVFPNTFTSEGVESSLDLIANDKNDIETLKMLAKIKHMKTLNTAIFGFYKDFFNLNDKFIEKKIKINDTYISGGFVEKEIMHYELEEIEEKEIEINKNQINAFEDILHIFKSNNIDFILIQAPMTHDYYNSYINPEYFDEKMSSYGEYINFNNILDLDDSTYFFDSNHMNQDGVVIFNEKLIELLKEKGFIE